MEKRRDVFQAIADPTRRDILHLISRQALNLNSIAEHFDTTRPTISEHIKILTECGLIIMKKKGRERYCEARLDKLTEVSDWVVECRKYWNEALDSLENYLGDLQSKNKAYGTASRRNAPRKK